MENGFIKGDLANEPILRLNDANSYESIGIFKLSKEKTPKAFANKVKELMDDCGLDQKEAEKEVASFEFELEIYYEEGMGLFAVETDAIENGGDIYSPYSGKKYE